MSISPIPPIMRTLIATASETIKQSFTSFVENELKSDPEELNQSSVSELSCGLEQCLLQAGQEAIRGYIEEFECREDRIEREGKIYRCQNKESDKKFLTVFGEMTLTRRYYHCRKGGKGIVPLDEMWGMAGRYATPEIVEKVLWASSSMVASKVGEACKRLGNHEISTSCIQDITGKDGAAIADMLEEENEGVPCRKIIVPQSTEVFVASNDGVNVLMRKKGGRAGRKQQRPTLDNRGGDENGQSNTSYRNAMVGSFSFYQTVEGVVDMGNGVEGIVPHRLGSVYNARMPQEGAEEFKREFDRMINDIESKLEDNVVKILLADGARSIWKYVRENPIFKDYRLLLDYFHATEHLSLAAEAIFGTQKADKTAAKQWFNKWRHKLKYEENGAEGILRSMERYYNTAKLSKVRKEALRTQIVFYRNNKSLMNCAEHVANGWPIGSGPVEAACKSIVKARFCQSGMRWSTQGGRNILALRVLTNSNQWDMVWQKYSAENWRSVA